MIARDSLNTLLAKLVGISTSVLVNVILARILLAEGLGIWSILLAFLSLLVQVCGPGIAFANVYFVARKQWSVGHAWAATLFWSVLCGAAAYAIGAVIILVDLPSLAVVHDKLLIFLLLLALPAAYGGQWGLRILQGMHRIRTMNVVTVLAGMIYLVLTGVLVLWLGMGLLGAVLSYVGWHLAELAMVGIALKSTLREEKMELDRGVLRTAVTYGLKMYIGKLSSWASHRLDVLIAAMLLDPAQIGLYAIAVVVTEKLWLIPNAMSQALLPRVSFDVRGGAEKMALACRISLLTSLPIAAVLIIGGWWLLPLVFGNEFAGAYVPMLVILPGVMALGLSHILTASLIGANRPMMLSTIQGISAGANVVLNILLIPQFGASGCALASTGSYTLQTAWIMIWYCRYFRVSVWSLLAVSRSDWKALRSGMGGLIPSFKPKEVIQ